MSEDFEFESKHFQCCVSKAFENDSATAGSAWDGHFAVLPAAHFCRECRVAISPGPACLPRLSLSLSLPLSLSPSVQNGYLFPSSDTYFPNGAPSISKSQPRRAPPKRLRNGKSLLGSL